jgi:hypothetical protein
MGNSCSRMYNPCVSTLQLRKPICKDQQCGKSQNGESIDPECQSMYLLLNQSTALLDGEFEIKNTTNIPGFLLQASNSLEMLHPLLGHGVVSSPPAITNGNFTMLHTNVTLQQTNLSGMKQPCAQLQLYIVTWNMNGRVSLKYIR